jgi:uncharacterized protein (TIGR02145 family)
MKKILMIAVAVLITEYLSAQAPEKFKYQAVIRDGELHILTEQEIGMRIQIMFGSEAGAMIYAETHALKTGKDGLAEAEIGSGTVSSGSFADIDWSRGTYYINTAIDPAGGTSYTIEGTSQLLSVPYAFHAQSAGVVTNLTENQGLDDVIAVNDSAGTRIRDVTDPTDDQDMVTLIYFMYQMITAGLISLSGENLFDIVVDRDGNLYRTVRIDDLVWMNENLRTTKYNDGTNIPLVTDNAEWAGLTTPAYCWYGNAAANSLTAVTLGALYNWHAVNTENLCPHGWRIPTEEEWNSLITYLSGESVAGGKLKEAGTKFWLIPNNATNESNFGARPGGFRSFDGFESIGNSGFWWSSTEASADNAGSLGLINNLASSSWLDLSKKTGMSVRCVSESGMRGILLE